MACNRPNGNNRYHGKAFNSCSVVCEISIIQQEYFDLSFSAKGQTNYTSCCLTSY